MLHAVHHGGVVWHASENILHGHAHMQALSRPPTAGITGASGSAKVAMTEEARRIFKAALPLTGDLEADNERLVAFLSAQGLLRGSKVRRFSNLTDSPDSRMSAMEIGALHMPLMSACLNPASERHV